jgi:hypothetical protein
MNSELFAFACFLSVVFMLASIWKNDVACTRFGRHPVKLIQPFSRTP